MYATTEDSEALGILAYLDERTKLEQTEVCGKTTVTIHKGYASKHLFIIEQFVQDIELRFQGEFLGKEYCLGKRMTVPVLYEKYSPLLNDWLQRYSGVHRYSPRVEAFYDACMEVGLIDGDPFWFDQPDDIANADGMRHKYLFTMLIDQIRLRCQKHEFRERERLRLVNADRNMRNVLALEEAMFSEKTGRSRWLILSLTLRYRPTFRDAITVEIIQQHRDRFFAARRFNTLMSGIKNYVWTIEQGEDTGLHLHVILFYSADHNHDQFVAQRICEYWVDEVTGGKGDYWNSNAARLKSVYARHGHGVGVGQINRNDAGKRDALRKNLVYLAKAEQYLLIKGAENMRTFGMGRVPKKVRVGRLRADSGMRSSEIDGVALVVGVPTS